MYPNSQDIRDEFSETRFLSPQMYNVNHYLLVSSGLSMVGKYTIDYSFDMFRQSFVNVLPYKKQLLDSDGTVPLVSSTMGEVMKNSSNSPISSVSNPNNIFYINGVVHTDFYKDDGSINMVIKILNEETITPGRIILMSNYKLLSKTFLGVGREKSIPDAAAK